MKWCFSCQKPLKNVKILDFCKKRARRAGRHSKNKKKFNDAIIRWYDFGTKKNFFFFPFALSPGAYVGSESHILKNIRVVAWRQGVYLEKWTKVEEKFENHSGHLWIFFIFDLWLSIQHLKKYKHRDSSTLQAKSLFEKREIDQFYMIYTCYKPWFLLILTQNCRDCRKHTFTGTLILPFNSIYNNAPGRLLQKKFTTNARYLKVYFASLSLKVATFTWFIHVTNLEICSF